YYENWSFEGYLIHWLRQDQPAHAHHGPNARQADPVPSEQRREMRYGIANHTDAQFNDPSMKSMSMVDLQRAQAAAVNQDSPRLRTHCIPKTNVVAK
ncbi:MAG: hypothetical protein Q9181_003534, partial [Wetmoreana brouardii]